MPQGTPKDMHTALFIEKGAVNAQRFESQELTQRMSYIPTNDALDKRMKVFHQLERVELGERFVGLYYRPESGITKEDALAIGRAEADKFLNPEKYKAQESEVERLRRENARLTAELSKKK